MIPDMSVPPIGEVPLATFRSNASNDLFEAMLREVYDDIEWLGCGHHIMYKRASGKLPEEIASPDSLIFDHDIARKIWGSKWSSVLATLAVEPPETRDAVLRKLYYER